MNSRDKILNKIKDNKPEFVPLPELKDFERENIDLKEKFKTILASIGGQGIEVNKDKLEEVILSQYADCKVIVSLTPKVKGSLAISQITDPHDLKGVDLAIIKGQFGVAENAAIWLTEKELFHRALGFITQHLVIILDKNEIVWNMHQAYKKLSIEDVGYGLFLAGPSKTADIEQALVIGAHGARSLTVYLI
jgi:L-lactate dehydrogenase complex protein LldG